jgi:hypothetical protein
MTFDELFKGWFDRDGNKFVKLVKTNRLSWEEEKHSEEGFSTFLTGKISDEDLIRKAYQYGKDTIATMGLPYRVTLKLHPTMSATDHVRMYVSTECFDEKSLTPNQKLDVFLGLTIHECCHILYTDNEYLKKQPQIKHPILHSIWNTIEDEMIETRCASDSPGYMNYLAATKDYMFNFKYQKRLAEAAKARALAVANGEAPEEEAEMPLFDKLMDILFKIVRYPKYLKPEDFAFYGSHIVKLKEILCPYPMTTEDCWMATLKIWDLLKDFYKEPPASAEKGLKIAVLTDEMPDGDAEEDDGEEPDIIIDMRTGSQQEIPDLDANGEPLKGSIDAEAKKSKVLIAIEEITSLGLEHGGLDGANGVTLTRKDMAEILKKLPTLAPILECSLEEGDTDGVYFEKMAPNKDAYLQSKQNINKFIGPVRTALLNHGRDIKIVHKGMRSGLLDSTKLVEALCGVPTIYERYGSVKSDKLCIVLVDDESGSMDGDKIEAAQDSTVLLNEALETIPYIDLYCYGHTADYKYGHGSTAIQVYKEPGWNKKYTLGSVEARANNRDGVALLEIAKRVRKHTSMSGIMFVMADGQPNAHGYQDGVKDTRSKVKQIQKMGFQVVQVAIEHGHDPKTMFDHYIILKDVSKLARDLSIVVRKAAEKLSKIHIT